MPNTTVHGLDPIITEAFEAEIRGLQAEEDRIDSAATSAGLRLSPEASARLIQIRHRLADIELTLHPKPQQIHVLTDFGPADLMVPSTWTVEDLVYNLIDPVKESWSGFTTCVNLKPLTAQDAKRVLLRTGMRVSVLRDTNAASQRFQDLVAIYGVQGVLAGARG